ncbi:MAG: sigma 54-interacting transcriptional regulator [Planctomycetes bacterium]|nr:sigma 54-interacting transcriptional regulator [Planctomycetota bacterium]
MENRRVKILLIDDDEDDFLITRDLLDEIGGQKFHLEWISDYEAGLAAIAQNQHEVYLLDFRLGERNGLELLCEAIQKGCKAPIILLTGQGDYEVDVEAMKAGAADYLVKDQMSAPLLERSIRHAIERARTLEALRVSEERYARSYDDLLSILNQLRLGTAMTDKDGAIAFLSQTAQRFFGIKEEEVLGKPWEELFPFHEADKTLLRNMFDRPSHMRAKVPVHLETPGGPQYWMEIDVRDDPRNPQRKIFFLYDMTEVRDLRRLLNEKERFQELVGKSKPMQLVYQQIRQAATVDWTVLIEGETGTGKELVARSIHSSSHRKEKPFIAVNCAGLTDSLLSSQLFGHKRGAFTGAIEDHQGFFEAASGGTIFLDEMGDIPMNVQTSLLRVLEEKEVLRLGDSTPRKVDARVIAATHRSLNQALEEGRFRADLLFRIRVLRIQLPSLRERREDIPLLIGSFLGKCRAVTGKPVDEVSTEALRILMDYPWPGNVRELRSTIEFAVLRGTAPVIQKEDLPPEIAETGKPPPPFLDAGLDEKESLLAALKAAKGNRTAAARLLGISRATFYRRLVELKIDPVKE